MDIGIEAETAKGKLMGGILGGGREFVNGLTPRLQLCAHVKLSAHTAF